MPNAPQLKRLLPTADRCEEAPNSFVRSTQLLSNRERDHLVKFVRLKQRERQRKAKVEQQNIIDMKVIRKKAKRLYKQLDCEDIISEEFSPTLTRE